MTSNLADAFRVALLTEIFNRMERDPDEGARIRAAAQAQLDLQRRRNLSGKKFQDRWQYLLRLDVHKLRSLLLGPGPDAAELRHAHMFAGCLPPREMNQIRSGLRDRIIKNQASL